MAATRNIALKIFPLQTHQTASAFVDPKLFGGVVAALAGGECVLSIPRGSVTEKDLAAHIIAKLPLLKDQMFWLTLVGVKGDIPLKNVGVVAPCKGTSMQDTPANLLPTSTLYVCLPIQSSSAKMLGAHQYTAYRRVIQADLNTPVKPTTTSKKRKVEALQYNCATHPKGDCDEEVIATVIHHTLAWLRLETTTHNKCKLYSTPQLRGLLVRLLRELLNHTSTQSTLHLPRHPTCAQIEYVVGACTDAHDLIAQVSLCFLCMSASTHVARPHDQQLEYGYVKLPAAVDGLEQKFLGLLDEVFGIEEEVDVAVVDKEDLADDKKALAGARKRTKQMVKKFRSVQLCSFISRLMHLCAEFIPHSVQHSIPRAPRSKIEGALYRIEMGTMPKNVRASLTYFAILPLIYW
jgi:hypothetical protein